MRVKKRKVFWLGTAIFLLMIMWMPFGKTVSAAEKKVVKVALGGTHSAAITSDGELWMWGSNECGEIGNGKSGTNQCLYSPEKIMDNVSQVSLSNGSSSNTHSGAVTKDGTLYMWGKNDFGQLGNGTTNDSLKPIKIMDNVSDIVLGERKSAAIKKDGSLWVWGYNGNNDLGTGDGKHHYEPTKLLDNVVQVDLGSSHGAALKNDGSLWRR